MGVPPLEELCAQIGPDLKAYVTWPMVRQLPDSLADQRLARLADRAVKAVSGIASTIAVSGNVGDAKTPEIIDAICVRGFTHGGAIWEVVAARWEQTRTLIREYESRQGARSRRIIVAKELERRGFL